MSTKQYDYAVFIGRFQPFHIGHEQVLNTALSIAEKVIVVIGSADQTRTPKNPWTKTERSAMILSMDLPFERMRIAGVRDQAYNDQVWASNVQEAVEREINLSSNWSDFPPKVCIIGHSKDESSFYLKLFPQWELVEHPMIEEISATELRELYFEQKNLKFLQSVVPASVFKYLETFKRKPEYKTLVEEYEFIKTYKKSWEAAPYPPTFITTDAVVIQSGHILLVERKAAPGKGTWALPGGFVNQTETLEDAMLRELREETKLKVPEPVLRGSIKESKVFDAPGRSLRGRTITNAYMIVLPGGPLPKVKGSDDAKTAKWFSIQDVKKMSDKLFEDHYDIIMYFVGRV